MMDMRDSRQRPRLCAKATASRYARGFTIVELMVALTLSLLVLAGLVTLFSNSSVARLEVDKSSRQIESGRFAMQTLSDEIRHAGYFGSLTSAPTVPGVLPDPCSTTTATAQAAIGLPIQGYAGQATVAAMTALLSCLDAASGYVPNTAVLVVRRMSTTTAAATPASGFFNMQVSGCAGDLNAFVVDTAASTAPYVLHAKSSTVGCLPLSSAPAALISPIFTRIYFISTCSNQNDCSAAGADSVPTLKRIDVVPGATPITAITDGIENLQFEYGLDGDNDGAPNSYSTTTVPPSTVAAWADVVSVRVHLLARNTDKTGGYTDVKTYALGSGTSVTPGGAFKRHAYDEVVRVNNVAGRRE